MIFILFFQFEFEFSIFQVFNFQVFSEERTKYQAIHLAPFPDDDFRWRIAGLVGASLAGTFCWDRASTALFAPHIFKAQLEEIKAITDVQFMILRQVFDRTGESSVWAWDDRERVLGSLR